MFAEIPYTTYIAVLLLAFLSVLTTLRRGIGSIGSIGNRDERGHNIRWHCAQDKRWFPAHTNKGSVGISRVKRDRLPTLIAATAIAADFAR